MLPSPIQPGFGRNRSTETPLYCIVLYIDIYIALLTVSKTEALSVHFSSRKKIRLKARERERRGKGSRENKRVKRRREVIPE